MIFNECERFLIYNIKVMISRVKLYADYRKEISLLDIVLENNEIAFVAYYEDGAVKFTNDLDLIYDIYVKEKEEA